MFIKGGFSVATYGRYLDISEAGSVHQSYSEMGVRLLITRPTCGQIVVRPHLEFASFRDSPRSQAAGSIVHSFMCRTITMQWAPRREYRLIRAYLNRVLSNILPPVSGGLSYILTPNLDDPFITSGIP